MHKTSKRFEKINIRNGGAQLPVKNQRSLALTSVKCCICETDNAEPVGKGDDYEYRTSDEKFEAMRCNSCGLIYLNPRPSVTDFSKIYPPNYHAFDFSPKNYGIVHKIRSKIEASRFLKRCHNLPTDARILDIGCGDGFHLDLFRRFGKKTWRLEGVDLDERAVKAATNAGFNVHLGSIEEIDLPQNAYDIIFMIQTIEHVENPVAVLRTVRKLLKNGGRMVIVTDNTGSIDFDLFKSDCWGGYHFPRHWNLFNQNCISLLGLKTGFEIETVKTIVSPVNWVYSIHNFLVARHKPDLLINRFTLKSTVSLTAFTVLDFFLQKFGRGALLEATFQKPHEKNQVDNQSKS
ncbi:MAG: class I SAM-dependent methyltransferase [Bacteroidota bacterium]|nr:class I SAM-dependent methyltransferase [Bacteroidota bacterium]